MKFLKRMFYLLFEHKTSTVYKWFERKKWRNICHGKLSSFHLEGMINEILPNSLEELFTKQSFRLYCRLFLPKNCFEQRPKTKKNGIYFWCKVYSADYFYGFPNPCLCNFELGEVYLNLLRIKFKHYLHQSLFKSHKNILPSFSKTYIDNIYHCSRRTRLCTDNKTHKNTWRQKLWSDQL